MKKIILLNSPIYNKKVADSEDYLPPLGLGYIATYLKKNGIDVKILDCVYNNLTINEILGVIEKEKPDFVGVNIFSVNMELVKEIIEKCKTKTSFIVGGKSAKFMYNDIINFNTDNSITVTIGEGEYITLDIVNECVKQESIVKNKKDRKVYCVDGNSIYFPADISKLELDRSFFEDRRTKNIYGKEEEAIVTSRECLYNCAFCGGARSLNRDVPVRVRGEQDIIEELKQIQKIHPGTQSIRILDDLFLKNEDSIKMAIRIFKQFPFEWRAMAHIKSLQGSEELFSQLEKSGCRELEIGIESGNENMRKRIHKIGTTAEIYEVISKILENGINVKGYFMYGFPNETKEQCKDTYILAAKLTECAKNKKGKFRTSAFQFRPYHGTELYNILNKKITYKHNDSLDVLKGRSQFNFMAENFSACSQEFINKIVIETNKLGSEIEAENDREDKEL